MVDSLTLRLVRYIDVNQAQQQAIRTRLDAAVRISWLGLGSWRDADVERWANRVIPIAHGAQTRTAALQAAYHAAVASAALGETVAPVPVAPGDVTTTALRGVDTSDVYRRPAVATWTALSDGKPLASAVDVGLRRALSIVSTDQQLAKTRTSHRVLSSSDRVVGYSRVLTGSESCGLCAVASTQRYHRGDLMPIHPGCDCGIAEIYGDRDPGQVINQERLDATHESILDTFGSSDAGARSIDPRNVNPTQYRDLLIVHEHGEIGPVLGVRGQHFDGPTSIAA